MNSNSSRHHAPQSPMSPSPSSPLITGAPLDGPADCTLACDEGHLTAHKIMLCAHSKYLQDILSRFPNAEHPIIILTELNITEIKILVNYMYTGELVITNDGSPASLLRAAQILKIDSLTDFDDDDDQNNNQPDYQPRHPGQQYRNSSSQDREQHHHNSSGRDRERDRDRGRERDRERDRDREHNNNNNHLNVNNNNNNGNGKYHPMHLDVSRSPSPTPSRSRSATPSPQPMQLPQQLAPPLPPQLIKSTLNNNSNNTSASLGRTRGHHAKQSSPQRHQPHKQPPPSHHREQQQHHQQQQQQQQVQQQISTLIKDSNNKIKCHLCKIGLSDVKCLYRHVLTRHLPQKWGYKCEFCDREFSRDDHLMRHYTTKHKNMDFNREKIRETRRLNREMAKNFHDEISKFPGLEALEGLDSISDEIGL